MTLSLISGPSIEPVSVDEAKLFLRIDDEVEDEVIAALVTTARLHIERVTRRILIEQKWRLYLDELPEKKTVEIGVGPVQKIDRILRFDSSGVPAEVMPQDYVVDLASVPARIKFKRTFAFQGHRNLNAYEVEFTAGFGTTTLTVPHDLRQAVLMLTAHWYENRSAVSADIDLMVTPKGFSDLIQPYRVVNL